jgi:glucokinase
MSGLLAGVDIGGTKCGVCLGEAGENGVQVLARRRFLTPASPGEALEEIAAGLSELLAGAGGPALQAIGVSCGGPLDSRAGLVLSPPNLPGWDWVDVLTPLRARFGAPAGLQNDANACALAEWKWGAGQGCRNLIFLTFGTGMGAGLILDGRLYSGTNNMAGEVGHIRLDPEGPVGYGKAGSFEGFCSGGGIAQLARSIAEERLRAGESPAYCPSFADLPAVTAEKVGAAALAGDETALQVWGLVGRQLGRGLAILVDVLNPERIILGSIYGHQRALLEPVALRVLAEEAIPHSLSVCQIVPAGLGENVGDYAGLSVAMQVWQDGPAGR